MKWDDEEEEEDVSVVVITVDCWITRCFFEGVLESKSTFSLLGVHIRFFREVMGDDKSLDVVDPDEEDDCFSVVVVEAGLDRFRSIFFVGESILKELGTVLNRKRIILEGK